jgi:cyclophilin family peptidyl-prolyl cis-trans isomerase
MNPRISQRSLWLAALISSALALPQLAGATIVTFETVMGDFEVNLYDNGTPATVANFLNYVNSGAYSNTIYHRSVPGFVVQGGGFIFDDITLAISPLVTNPAVVNEPVFSNVAGTIAMAKLSNGTDPANSATSQWFFNLVDNSGGNAQLDTQNAGFTVFGEVDANGMAILNAIAALQTFDLRATLGDAFGQLPLQNYTPPADPDGTNLMLITGISVTNMTVDSAGAAGLNPPLNTLINAPPPPPPPTGGGGGGGSFSFFALIGLLLTYRFRRA